jgi:pimeloyl-ACP methyl ester carboxylesterase
MQIATTDDDVSIAWESQGSGAPLVLVHGVTEDHRLWGAIADELAERFQVILLDLRGHGASGRATDYSPLTMTRDLVAVVDAAGVGRPVVIGHSLGVYDLLFRTPDDELLHMTEELMAGIDAPYLLVHGADPGQEYLDWVTTHLPTATVEVWPDTGHFLHLVHPERFVRRLFDFLAA